jgi:hypothetical protein
VGNLLYLTQGGTKIPKEFLEVFGGGQAAQLHNFESLILYPQSERRKIGQGKLDKGQKNEMEAFINAVKTAGPMPISVDSLFDTTITTLASIKSVQTRQTVELIDYWVAN